MGSMANDVFTPGHKAYINHGADIAKTAKDYGTVPKTSDEDIHRQVTWRERLFPTGFKKELKGLSSLAWPAGLAGLFVQSFGIVSLMFCGQLGRAELDGVGLALSLLNITGLSVGLGLITACDTLFSQAYGAKNKHLVGIYLQRSILVITLSTFVCWSIHLNTEGLLIKLGQDREVAKIAGIYLLYFTPGLLFNFLFQVFVKYLQNQNRVHSAVILGAVGNLANALAQYLAIQVLEAGIIGSALGQVIAYFFMLAITVGYIVCTGLYKETWTGWSWEALEQWGQFLYLAVAGLIMIAIEWWSFEIGLFLNGIIGEVELGATSVVFQLEQIIYMVGFVPEDPVKVPYGMGVASSIRVGHSLGAGNAKAAKTTAMTSQLLAWLCLLVTATVILSMKNLLPLLFTQDPEVIPMASSILPILVIILFLDSIVATSMGTLRGCGRQWTAAICNAVGYLGISIPIAVVFMFIVGIGAFGFWWAMCLGISPTACLYIYFLTRRINWDNEVHKARERTTTRRKVKVIEETAPLISDETNVDETADGKTGQPNGTRLSEALDYERTMSTDESVFRKRLIVLVVKRVFGCLSVLALFVASICIRLFVPLPAEPSIIPAMNVTMATATSPDYDI